LHPLATVVVVTFQSARFIDPCLTALRGQTLPAEDFRVVVVDNASTDGSADLVAERHPWVRLVRNRENLGFGAGCERGRREVPSDHVVLVNGDAVVAPDFLEAILAPLVCDPEVAAVTGHVVLAGRFVPDPWGEISSPGGRRWRRIPEGFDDPDAVELLNSTGGEITSDGYGYDRGFGAPDEDTSPLTDVFAFCGAAAALRSSALDEVGGFDEDYFLYYEDLDVSWRMRLAGYRIVYAVARARHQHQGSTGRGSSLHAYYDLRNRLLTVAKDAPPGLAWAVWLRYPATVASLAVRELPRTDEASLRVRAGWAAAILLPRTLRLRRRARANSATSRRVDAFVRAQPSAAKLA
jgi:hypothetical protein